MSTLQKMINKSVPSGIIRHIHIKVRHNDRINSLREICIGLSQEAVLNSLLFNIHNVDAQAAIGADACVPQYANIITVQLGATLEKAKNR